MTTFLETAPAPHPLDLEADAVLEVNDRLVLPDILANARGVIVSFFEWVQADQASWWSEQEVELRLAERMHGAWDQVLARADRIGAPLRVASTTLAVERVAQAHRQRGLYP